MNPDRKGKLLVVTGPSGVGKSTIIGEVLRRVDVDYSVSATTRNPRSGEMDGRDYRFMKVTEFEKMIDAGDLLEWARIFGNYYGTPRAPVEESIAMGRTVILEIDVQGGLQVYKKMPEETFVLIVPPSRDELRSRLDSRGTESEETLQRRLERSEEELKLARESGIYTNEIVNNQLETTIEKLVALARK